MASEDKNQRPVGKIRSVLGWLMEPGESLGSKALNAGLWASLLRISMRLLRLIRTIALARLLAPGDFGLFGIAVIALSTVDSFTNTGMTRALIQRKGDIKEHLNTAWTVTLIRGFLLGTVLFFGAPLAGRFFGTPDAVALIRAIALVPVGMGLFNIGVVYFDKELLFRQRFLFRSLPAIVELIGSILLAIWLQNAWALLLGRVISVFFTAIASYVAHPYRPRFHIDRARFRELLHFGKWISASSILIYLMLNLDDIIVGRFLTPRDLGLYQMAFTISTIVTIEVSSTVNQVTFPAFSKLQGDKQGLRVAFLETAQLVAFVSFPVTAGLWFVGPEAIETLLGEKWIGLLPAFLPLLIWGLTRAVSSTVNPLFSAIGKPYVNTAIYATATGLLAIFIVPFTRNWGIEGAAWATVIAATAYLAQYVLVGREVDARWQDTARAILIPAALTVVMLLVLVAVTQFAPQLEETLFLIWAPVLGIAVYALSVFVSKRIFGYAPLQILWKYVPRRSPDISE